MGNFINWVCKTDRRYYCFIAIFIIASIAIAFTIVFYFAGLVTPESWWE